MVPFTLVHAGKYTTEEEDKLKYRQYTN